LRGVGLGGWCVVLFGDGGEHGGALGVMRSAWVLLSRLGENPRGGGSERAGIHAVDRRRRMHGTFERESCSPPAAGRSGWLEL